MIDELTSVNMSKPTVKEKKSVRVVNEIGQSSRDQTFRHSFQPKSTSNIESPSLRHTRSQNYGHNYGTSKKKVKVPAPAIPEINDDDKTVDIDVLNNRVTLESEKEKSNNQRKSSKTSEKLRKNSKAGIDNAGFVEDNGSIGKISRGSSVANSVRSSLRDPSVQSLTYDFCFIFLIYSDII